MKLQELRSLIRSEIRRAINESKRLNEDATESIIFSGYDNFMDSKRVLSLFAKYGIDKTKMKRTYDPDSETVELSMKLDTNIANKIGDALEALPTADDNYGGYIIESKQSKRPLKKAINENYRTPDQNLDELIKLLKSNKTKSALELVLSVKSNLEDADFETAFDEAVEMWLDYNS
jgi:hypothetical protein